MAEADIDLYADDLDNEFNADSDFNHENEDLYDDVIAVPSEDASADGRPLSRGSSSPNRHIRTAGKRAAAYIGNLTWWTTDQDIIDGMQKIGVTDVVEVKFFENRANGQSKGFCVVSFASENSVRLVTDKFPKKTIHGQTPLITPYTRQNLNYFELLSRKGHVGNRYERDPVLDRHSREREAPRPMTQDRLRSRSDGPQPYAPQRGLPAPHMHHIPPQGPPPSQYQPGGAPWMSAPPPQIQQMSVANVSRPGAPMVSTTSIPPPPPGLQGPPLPRPTGPPPVNMRVPPPSNMRGPPPPVSLRQVPPPDTRGPPPAQHDWERPNVSQPPPQVGIPPQLGLPTRPPPPVPAPGQGLPPSIPPPAPHAPSPHINPAFFHQQGIPPSLVAASQTGDIYSRPPPAQFPEYRPTSERSEPTTPSISDAEFEEIMGRNRTVSSSAIARAVADASSGDYASAIETLVTAISLIKQCKIADDERCKILISSLQDTLHGIESKSYGSRSKERARSRERDRSRERSSRREKSSRRDRSRSRDREYRDRSRERDRYHDDRYRDKDRDHDRDRRSSRH